MSLSRKQLARVILENLDNDKKSVALKSVAAYLISEGRSRELELVIRELELATKDRHSHVLTRVRSARELTDSAKQQIKDMVIDFENVSSVELIESIDTSLLGGVVLNTPESEIDLSIQGKLARMKGQR